MLERAIENGKWLEFICDEITNGFPLETDRKKYSNRRRRLYALLQIPMRIERFIFYGLLQCIDVFLYLFTFLPIRLLLSVCFIFRKKPWSSAEICDFIKAGIIICATSAMFFLDTSVIYHIIRSQGFVKLYIFYNMLEVADKLLSTLGQDILDSLLWSANEPLDFKSSFRSILLFLVAVAYTSFHTFLVILQVAVLIAIIQWFQATTLNVAVNSHNGVLLAILMSNNFVELKGSVFKKISKNNLFQIICSDVRERFHLTILLVVVVIRNMTAVNWCKEHFLTLLPDVAMVLSMEVVVDWLKYIFISKFNEINIDVYNDFSQTIARNIVKSRNSHSTSSAYSDQFSRQMGFIPIPLSVIVIRVLAQTFSFTHLRTIAISFLIIVTMSFYGLLEVSLFILNGIAILHRERFLKKYGFGAPSTGFDPEPTFKNQLINLIFAVQTVMRMPLIPINLVVILLKLVLG